MQWVADILTHFCLTGTVSFFFTSEVGVTEKRVWLQQLSISLIYHFNKLFRFRQLNFSVVTTKAFGNHNQINI